MGEVRIRVKECFVLFFECAKRFLGRAGRKRRKRGGKGDRLRAIVEQEKGMEV